jgi:hypothetical protein
VHRVSPQYLIVLAIVYIFAGGMIGVFGTHRYLLTRGLIAPRQGAISTQVALDLPPLAPTPILPTGTPEPEQGRIEQPPEIVPSPEPTPEIWGDLDLTNGISTYFTVHTPDLAFATGEFYPWSYREGIFESDLFDPDEAGAVSWTDQLARIVLWVHSGPNHTISVLQRFIELDERGYIVSGARAEERIRQEIMDSPFEFVQGHTSFWTHMTAWARIPPDEVEELNEHVSDLPEYLREQYPDQGWEGFNRDTLIIFFCGRQLTGDPHDPTRPYWQQTRYVLGLLPLTRNQIPTGYIASLGGIYAEAGRR